LILKNNKTVKQYMEVGDEKWDDGGAARLCVVVWVGDVQHRRGWKSGIMTAWRSNSDGTSFEGSGVGWDISKHVFQNNIFVYEMNYGTKCSIMLNLEC